MINIISQIKLNIYNRHGTIPLNHLEEVQRKRPNEFNGIVDTYIRDSDVDNLVDNIYEVFAEISETKGL